MPADHVDNRPSEEEVVAVTESVRPTIVALLNRRGEKLDEIEQRGDFLNIRALAMIQDDAVVELVEQEFPDKRVRPTGIEISHQQPTLHGPYATTIRIRVSPVGVPSGHGSTPSPDLESISLYPDTMKFAVNPRPPFNRNSGKSLDPKVVVSSLSILKRSSPAITILPKV